MVKNIGFQPLLQTGLVATSGSLEINAWGSWGTHLDASGLELLRGPIGEQLPLLNENPTHIICPNSTIQF